MSDNKEIFYSNEDYTVRIKIINDTKKYFIKFHMSNSPECEINFDIFNVYLKEFNKPIEIQKNEQRRHIEAGEFDDLIESDELTVNIVEDEDKLAIKCDIDKVLKTCTPVQQKRFNLYYMHGYSFRAIAAMEKCDFTSVKKSVYTVLKKIKNIFN